MRVWRRPGRVLGVPDGARAVSIGDLVGLTLVAATAVDTAHEGVNDELHLDTADGRRFRFFHDQNCCETVSIEDICGDLADLVGSPITQAEEEVSGQDVNPPGVPVPTYQDSFTWTFYKFATIKGSVTVRWYGESNGYYSESVDLRVGPTP